MASSQLVISDLFKIFEGSDGFNMLDYGGGIADPNIYAAGSGFLRSKAVVELATSCKHGGSGVGPT